MAKNQVDSFQWFDLTNRYFRYLYYNNAGAVLAMHDIVCVCVVSFSKFNKCISYGRGRAGLQDTLTVWNTLLCVYYINIKYPYIYVYIIYARVWVCLNNGVLRNTVYTRYRYILLLLLSDRQKGTQSLVPRCSCAYNYTWPVYPNIVGRLIYATSSSVYIYYIAAAGIVRCVVRFYFFPITGEKNPSVHSKRKRFVCKCTHTHTHT